MSKSTEATVAIAAESAATKPQAGETASPTDAKAKMWPKEIGGPKGPEPTRYGDWERNGRCTDF